MDDALLVDGVDGLEDLQPEDPKEVATVVHLAPVVLHVHLPGVV